MVGIMTKATDQILKLAKDLKNSGFDVLDMSTNELAKEHARHMVGGKAGPKNERLVHFEFPERPSALSDFLKVLGRQWNISLFHYRGAGSDVGRVLIGFNVPTTDTDKFNQFVKNVKYYSHDETNNPAYKTFLKSNE
jgi:threonine dehydratase